jgi:hypothetical protein
LQSWPKIFSNEGKILQRRPKIFSNAPKILQSQPKIFSNAPKILQSQPKIFSNEAKILNKNQPKYKVIIKKLGVERGCRALLIKLFYRKNPRKSMLSVFPIPVAYASSLF